MPILAILIALVGSLFLSALPARALPSEPLAAPSHVQQLPLSKVMLYSSGVGYFQHDGTVQGESHVDLRFTVDQINDVLKRRTAIHRSCRVGLLWTTPPSMIGLTFTCLRYPDVRSPLSWIFTSHYMGLAPSSYRSSMPHYSHACMETLSMSRRKIEANGTRRRTDGDGQVVALTGRAPAG